MSKITYLNLFIFSLLIAGCAFFSAPNAGVKHLMPAGTPYQTDYLKNVFYRLKQPVFVSHWIDNSAGGILPDQVFWKEDDGVDRWIPDTVVHYLKDRPSKWPGVVEVLPIGSIVQYKEMRIVYSPMIGEIAHPLMVTLNPERASKGQGKTKMDLVDAVLISTSLSGLSSFVDPSYLELVSAQPHYQKEK